MKMRYQKLWFTLLLPICSNTCQKPLTSYLQLLPFDLLREQLNYVLTDKPVWNDDEKPTRIERTILVGLAIQQVCDINFTQLIINRMRSDLITKRELDMKQEEFCSKEATLLIESFFGGDFPKSLLSKPFDSPDNPKHFNFLLPLKAVLAYSQIDQKWLKEFIISKKCGGSLRKHLFINALKYQDEFWVNYLWDTKYHRKTIAGNIPNIAFLRMAIGTSNHTNYAGIHGALQKTYDERMARMKAAKTWHPNRY